MFEYIEKLRQKPDNAKRRIAFLVALSISGLIFVIWLSVLYPNWKNEQKKQDITPKSDPSPLSGFTDNIFEGFSGIKGQFFKLKESVSIFTDWSEDYSNTELTASTTDNSQ